jgi:N4-gp56 family major capsid protein
MPATAFGTNDPRTQKKWSTDVFEYALQNIALTPLMGSDKNSLIHVNQELTKGKGDVVIFESTSPMSGAGQGDGGNTTGNEESLKRRNFSVKIHERSHSYVSDGPLSEQRTATNIREDGKVDLGSWFAEAMENDLITSMAGLYNVNSSSNAIATINESYPTSNRIYYGGQNAAGTLGNSGVSYATDALLTAGTQLSNLFGTKLIEAIRRRCLMASPRFRPVTVRDLSKVNPNDTRAWATAPIVGKYFLVLAHPYQIKAVREESGTTGWAAMCAAAQNRGDLNPIFSGAAFLWDGCIVWEYDRIPTRTGAGGTTLAEGFLLNADRTATTDACANNRTVARALMLGAQAQTFAWAQRLKWWEDMVDCNKPKVKVDALYGVKRTNFNLPGTETATSDEAIYCMDTEVIVD